MTATTSARYPPPESADPGGSLRALHRAPPTFAEPAYRTVKDPAVESIVVKGARTSHLRLRVSADLAGALDYSPPLRVVEDRGREGVDQRPDGRACDRNGNQDTMANLRGRPRGSKTHRLHPTEFIPGSQRAETTSMSVHWLSSSAVFLRAGVRRSSRRGDPCRGRPLLRWRLGYAINI